MPKSFVDELLQSEEIADEICPLDDEDTSEDFSDGYGGVDSSNGYEDNYPDYAGNYDSSPVKKESSSAESSSTDNSYGNY